MLTRQVCEKRRLPQQMIDSKVRSQHLGKRPSCFLLYEVRTPPNKPTLALTFALEVALIPAAARSVGHIQRVPAEPSMHAAHALPFVGYGLAVTQCWCPRGIGG